MGKSLTDIFQCSGFMFEVLCFYGYYDEWQLLMTQLCKKTNKIWNQKQKMMKTLDTISRKDTDKIIEVLHHYKINTRLSAYKHLSLKISEASTLRHLKNAKLKIDQYELQNLETLTLIFDLYKPEDDYLEQLKELFEKLLNQDRLRISTLKISFEGSLKHRVDLCQENTPWREIWGLFADNLEKMRTNSLIFNCSKIKEINDYLSLPTIRDIIMNECLIALCDCKFTDNFAKLLETHSSKNKTIIYNLCSIYPCSDFCNDWIDLGSSTIPLRIVTPDQGLVTQILGLQRNFDYKDKCTCCHIPLYNSPFFSSTEHYSPYFSSIFPKPLGRHFSKPKKPSYNRFLQALERVSKDSLRKEL
ncbi:unnamed protein product [Moneuplotes crassus]|uniref:Uncharacterized protein n=1 Tax=Euplotes crassus TaxID=5936 RepID=A0AAD2CXG6_EUPCR|nr:unnamed protein product [Moneuplotes crassus]